MTGNIAVLMYVLVTTVFALKSVLFPAGEEKCKEKLPPIVKMNL